MNHVIAHLAKLCVDAGLAVLAVVALVYTLSALPSLMDGPSDVQAAADTEASLNEAIAQAQAERPDLWDTSQKERARLAAKLVAQGATE